MRNQGAGASGRPTETFERLRQDLRDLNLVALFPLRPPTYEEQMLNANGLYIAFSVVARKYLGLDLSEKDIRDGIRDYLDGDEPIPDELIGICLETIKGPDHSIPEDSFQVIDSSVWGFASIHGQNELLDSTYLSGYDICLVHTLAFANNCIIRVLRSTDLDNPLIFGSRRREADLACVTLLFLLPPDCKYLGRFIPCAHLL